MAELENNRISVIKQNDPDLPDYLDFDKLRKEGLAHIGNLSGKIWTDHNVHDPGVTILEVLIYAIMDLGYKTNLPFEDLIAFQNQNGKDDNFLTPLEILTNNPVTILDYRKLLLDVKGVRNAWLEVTSQESLYLNSNTNTLLCNTPNSASGISGITSQRYNKIELNGLYKVYVEKNDDGINNDVLVKRVKKTLNQHRNLCEDFVSVEVLKPLKIGVCLEAELHIGYVAEKIYKEIFEKIKQYIQPEITYYTLEELLDKGRAIDDIFAGRPYLDKSHGFVDTEELESFDRPHELHLSDLYQVILNIEGVRKVKNLVVKGGQIVNEESKDWVEGNRIPEGYVPSFSVENTCIDLYNAQGSLAINKPQVHKSFSFPKKFIMPIESLDTSVPTGRYREDLEEYYSIQNDFPVVYGIGEDGLPDRSTVQRKTQALQLKGYLLFYDQMLANYTSQLSHIRSLFSLKPENQRTSEDKKTYFTQIPNSIPGLEELLRFYNQNEVMIEGTILAVPISNNETWQKTCIKLKNNPTIELTIGNYCNDKDGALDLFSFSSTGVRTMYINQLIDSLFNEKYTIEILQDRKGYFFVIQAEFPDDVVLIGTNRYEKESEARKEAKNLVFIATMEQSYHLVTDASETIVPDKHFFDISYNPLSYINLIQEITEDKEEYKIRRKKFLDHLLARFGEEFTAYTVLQYRHKKDSKNNDSEIIHHQSNYINKFPEVSRNRGKAFDYSEPSWGTDNVSGFEKRISLLSGIENYTRHNLCNFEVLQSFRILLKDWTGTPFFRSNKGYESLEELYETSRKILKQLRDPESYKQLEKNLNGFDANTMHRIFSEKPGPENIIVTKYNYHQQLCNADHDIVVISKSMKMRSEKVGFDKKEDFIKNINTQTLVSSDVNKSDLYRLVPLDGKNGYIDANALHCDIETLITWKWHVYNEVAKENVACDQVFSTSDEAWQDMIQNAKLDAYLTTHDIALQWRLVVNKNVSFTAVDNYPDAYRSVAAWRQAKAIGSSSAQYEIKKLEEYTQIHLKNKKGCVIAISNEMKPDQGDFDTIIKDCVEVFGSRNTKPEYDKVNEKFGFTIFGKDNVPICVSYGVYDTAKEALEHIDTVFKLGESKTNYLLSGDQGNPEYNFILRDKYDSFLALPPDHFETESDRSKALNRMIRYVKNNKLPVFVKEEPRRYVWSLLGEEKETLLTATSEFTSKARAQANFDKAIVAEAKKSNNEFYRSHCYEFGVTATPAQYKYVYGISNTQKEFEPIFMSSSTFDKHEEASKGYTEFIKKIPGLSFKINSKKGTGYGLYASNAKEPMVVGYNQEGDLFLEKAKTVTSYIHKIYTKTLAPKESFVSREMVENQKGRYEWRFYKKNGPLAISPYQCPDKSNAARIKSIICDMVPLISLKQCPSKVNVICPEKDPYRFHYQVCFNDRLGNEFVLISYIGYDSHQEAEDAYLKQWLEIIQTATDRQEYQNNGLISLDEIYKNPEKKECEDASFIAVVPERIKQELEAQGKNVIDHYTRLADIFPIYEIKSLTKQSSEVKVTYKYKVVVPQQILEDTGCKKTSKIHSLGTLLWQSVDDYDTVENAINAYLHFYNLAGTSNNCRIFCEKGQFYVGLVEVLAESLHEYETEEQAWDDVYPKRLDDCLNCLPGGVREFAYAAEETKNYIPVCDQNYWKFKIVSPKYFVVDHNCDYDSEKLRDDQILYWISKLEQLDWDKYVIGLNDSGTGASNVTNSSFLSHIGYGYSSKELCDLVFRIREAFQSCTESEEIHRAIAVRSFLTEKYREDIKLCQVIAQTDFNSKEIQHLLLYFPVHKTDDGYCYRLYWPENDLNSTPEGLQPCGCGNDTVEVVKPCHEKYPFTSSNCYDCCTEALQAFIEFCSLITHKLYSIECISRTEYGPYSFQIIDKRQELAYHPQQYDSFQEVKNAIEITKHCANDVGMHLVEHILLRPQSEVDCTKVSIDANGNQTTVSCLLPVCPDYNCQIEWQPDMDKNDPCADEDISKIYYTPGSDPYSFWATIVMPSWHKRFRTKEQRETFETFLYKEAPALVGLHILWLSPRDLCKFEDTYKKWLAWKENPSSLLCYPNISSLNCALSDCIKTLMSEPFCESAPEQEGDCNCNKTEKDKEVTKGTMFWGYCPPDHQIPQDTITHLASSTRNIEVKQNVVKEPVKSKTISSKKKEITESKKNKISKTTKKEPVKAITKKKTESVLTVIRKRKPKYLNTIKNSANKAMTKTKSYERTLFFVENTPTIQGYTRLVDFFNKYSLQKDNNVDGFLILLKNATWHLLDALVLKENKTLSKAHLDRLKSSFMILTKKGLSLKKLHTEWKSEDLKSKAFAKPLSQMNKLLK